MPASDVNADRRGRPQWWRKLALLCLSMLFALALVEVLLHWLWQNPYCHEGPDRVVTLRLQHAHTNHRFNRAAIHPESPQGVLRSDARSYILPSFQFAEPDCTIAFLGGSTTECCAVAEELRFPALVSTRLVDHGLQVNTLNAGASGSTLHDSINNLLNHVMQDAPDLVVLMHACNDIGVLSERGSYAARGGMLTGWSDIIRMTLMRASAHSSILGLVRNVVRERLIYQPTEPAKLGPPPAMAASAGVDAAFAQRLRAFVRICHALEVQPVLMTQPLARHFTSLTPTWTNTTAQARFNDLIRQVGEQEGALVIDLVQHLETEIPAWDAHMNLFYDGMHVNDRGSQIYGEHIAARLLPLVQRIAGQPATTASPLQDEPPPRLAERPDPFPNS